MFEAKGGKKEQASKCYKIFEVMSKPAGLCIKYFYSAKSLIERIN